jgi:hypothetical protein
LSQLSSSVSDFDLLSIELYTLTFNYHNSKFKAQKSKTGELLLYEIGAGMSTDLSISALAAAGFQYNIEKKQWKYIFESKNLPKY